ncbi:MAG TPA: imidazole glycerol phosphate synthase subunit HisH, partial [Acidobacteriota bacterium]|nr:imidazole glycerol phosphate synthase subunit HisH [Acidobacteriota bacterium]
MSETSATVIVDYGMGNLRSVEKAFSAVGGTPLISGDPEVVAGSTRLVLPGVGAFGDAMENLRRTGLEDGIRAAVTSGASLLGLCLGLQLLFTESEEFGLHRGLGLIPGRVRKFVTPGL